MPLVNYRFKILISLCILLSCSDEKDKTSISTVNIDPKIDFLEYNLSEIAKNIRLIKLESNENSLINSMSSLIHIDQMNIIYRVGKEIIIFDADGKYKNKINSLGNGPNEYSTIVNVFVEANKKTIYIIDYKNISVYDYDGNFKYKIEKDIPSGGIYKSSDGNYVVAVKQNYVEKERKMLFILDSTLNEIASFMSRNTNDFKGFRQEFFFAGNPYEINGIIHYKEPLVDTIYKIKENKLYPHWIINSGEYKMDMRDVLSINKSNKAKDKITTPGIKETKTHFFIDYYFKNDQYLSVYDKGKDKFVYHKKYNEDDYYINDGALNIGIKNDLLEGSPSFWPSYISNDIIVSVSPPISLNEQQLNKFGVKEYDNPILFVAELK